MTTGYANAVNEEAEWFRLDLSADDVPPLHKDQGGPFDIVGDRPHRVDQAPRQLFLTHGPSRPLPGSKDSRHTQHEVLAVIFWPNPGAGQRSDQDQAALDAAMVSVLDRIRGPLGDVGRTHDGRWWRVGEPTVEPPTAATMLTFFDLVGAVGMGFEVIVRYAVEEWVDF